MQAQLSEYQLLHNIVHAEDEKNAAKIQMANIHQESDEGAPGVSKLAS